MKHSKLLLLLALLGALVLCAAGCGKEPGSDTPGANAGNPVEPLEGETPPIDINYPYEPETPAPDPHDGVFTSEHGTMTFNGDGKSVTIDFDEALAERLGLPTGEQAAKYEFFSGYLPPHGYISIRYDAAMEFQLTVGEDDDAVKVMIDIGEYEDGHFYTGTNCTTADRITFFIDGVGDNSGAIDFLKE